MGFITLMAFFYNMSIGSQRIDIGEAAVALNQRVRNGDHHSVCDGTMNLSRKNYPSFLAMRKRY